LTWFVVQSSSNELLFLSLPNLRVFCFSLLSRFEEQSSTWLAIRVAPRRNALSAMASGQFDGAGSVDGNRDDASFGQILKSQPGRVSQVAIKFLI
jgi:hypothetical protein